MVPKQNKMILESDCSYVVGLFREGSYQRSRLKFVLDETRGRMQHASGVDKLAKKRAELRDT